MSKPFSKGDAGGYAGLDDDGNLHRECCAFMWPVGAVMVTAANDNPADELGFGTWSSIGTFLIGITLRYAWERTA